jgi:hypothetical protein
MHTQVSAFAPPNVQLRIAPPVRLVSAADLARAELRHNIKDAIAKGRKALLSR